MNLQIALLLSFIAPLAASDGAGCSPSSSGDAAGAPPSTFTSDVNGNGVADAYEIATGSLSDDDLDGIPDEAQSAKRGEEDAPRG